MFWMCVWSQHHKVRLPRSCLAANRKRGCCEGPRSSSQTSPRGCGPCSCPAKGGLGNLASGNQSPTARVKRRVGSSMPLHWCDNGRPAYRGWYPWNSVDWSACWWSSTESSAIRVCANDKSDVLLVDLPAFQLMGCQQVVGLETPTEATFIHVEHVLLCVRINNDADVR